MYVGKYTLFVKLILQKKHASPNITYLVSMEGVLTHKTVY